MRDVTWAGGMETEQVSWSVQLMPHLVPGGEVRYLSDSNVDHHHHVSAVEDVRRLPAGEHVLQELEHGMWGRRGVFEYAHGVICRGKSARTPESEIWPIQIFGINHMGKVLECNAAYRLGLKAAVLFPKVLSHFSSSTPALSHWRSAL